MVNKAAAALAAVVLVVVTAPLVAVWSKPAGFAGWITEARDGNNDWAGTFSVRKHSAPTTTTARPTSRK